jgi:hypothetical protein
VTCGEPRPIADDSPAVVLGQLIVALVGLAVFALLVVVLLLWWGNGRAVDLDRDGHGAAQRRAARCFCDEAAPIARAQPRADRREVRTAAPESPTGNAVPETETSGHDTGGKTTDDPVTMPDEHAPPADNQTRGYLQDLLFFLAALPLGIAIWAVRRVVQTLPVWTRAVRTAHLEAATQALAGQTRRTTSRSRRRTK